MLQLKEKSWIWKLTGSFASNNYTTIGHTLYYPKGSPPSAEVMAHETIHERQQEEVGVTKYVLLYLLCAPFLWNQWRYKWEFEAYTKGSGLDPRSADVVLKSGQYGFLKFNKMPV